MEKQLNAVMEASLLETLSRIRKLGTEDLLRSILREIRKILDVERVSIFKVFNEFNEFHLIMGEPEGKHGVGQHFPFDSQKHLKRAVETKSWSDSPDPGRNPELVHLKELVDSEGITDIVAFPIIVENEAKWLIVVDAKYPRQALSKEETIYCEAMTNLAGFSLERDLMQKKQAEKEKLATLGKAAAEAAHRIRNPLDVIGGFAKRILKKFEKSGAEEDIKVAKIIVDEVSRLESLVTQLLKFSQPKKTIAEQVDLNEILKIETEKINRLIGQREIKIYLNLEEGLPEILIDPREMMDLFGDILKNAAEAIRGKGEIYIKSRRQDNHLVFCIANTGGCIDQETIQQIFNPFFTTKSERSGLGLAIADAVVRAYGGEIKAENDDHLNLTTFIVKLPIQ